MGHAERIIAEIASLDPADQARLIAFVDALKVSTRETSGSLDTNRAALNAALAPFTVRLDGFRFDREEANAR